MNTKTKILLVEDNEGDVVLTRKALYKAGMDSNLSIVRDGNEALMFLKKEGIFINAETPDLILLDINLPKVNGFDVLLEIKSNENLRMIPVVMLTTSDSENDILNAYYHYANWYITKPKDFHKFMEVVKAIKDCLIGIVKFPVHKKFDGSI